MGFQGFLHLENELSLIAVEMCVEYKSFHRRSFKPRAEETFTLNLTEVSDKFIFPPRLY